MDTAGEPHFLACVQTLPLWRRPYLPPFYFLFPPRKHCTMSAKLSLRLMQFITAIQVRLVPGQIRHERHNAQAIFGVVKLHI